MLRTRIWIFKVLCKLELSEKVCVVGSCDSLGSWDVHKSVILDKETVGNDTISTVTVQIPYNEVEFRYCICHIFEPSSCQESKFMVKKWETNILPRKLPKGESNSDEAAIHQFGLYGGHFKEDKGWLVEDSMVQLKFCKSNLYNDPVKLWKKKYDSRPCRLKISPIEVGENSAGLESFIPGVFEESTEETDMSDLRTYKNGIIEVAVMKNGSEKFKYQEQFGIICNNKDYIVFQCRIFNPKCMGYRIDVYIEENENEAPRYIGCSFVLPSEMTENYGVATAPITSPKQSPIGQLTVHYMVVYPMKTGNKDMSKSYTRYWKDSWRGLQVGHRGAGNSYHNQPKNCANIRENTIASLKYAAESGADMVEFDVQLSLDHIPVIYHDFHACIALKRKKQQDQNDLLEVPIKDLSLQQLQSLKDLSHLKEGIPCDILSYCDHDDMRVYNVKENGLNKFSDEDFEDHQPFPTLEKALDTVPVMCGFNIEVKWTMQMKDGTYELLHPFELNNFLDIILKMVIEKSGNRKIVFSCFHPDICTMLRFKQNKFPMLFLTQGVSDFWPPYDDELTSSITNAIIYATSAEILGINVHTEDVMRDPKQMELALDHNLIVFCWGDDNNDEANIKNLTEKGMHGIIYDKIDVFNDKKDKKSVFVYDDVAMLNETKWNQPENNSDPSTSKPDYENKNNININADIKSSSTSKSDETCRFI